MNNYDNLCNNPYQVAFNIMIKVLEYRDIYDGLINSLIEAKNFMKADEILLYRLDENNLFQYFCGTNNQKSDNSIGYLDEKSVKKIKNANDFLILDIDDKKVEIFSIELHDKIKYIVLIINNNINIVSLKDNLLFLEIQKKALSIILEKMELYMELKDQGEKDGLTKIGNRLSYEKKVKDLTNNNKQFVYVLIDLFRLKYVNDNINHHAGDSYIKIVAKLLQKYFPEYTFDKKNGINKKTKTNYHIYRIGGDEFVLIAEKAIKEDIEDRLLLMQDEIEKINFNTDKNLFLGINYGISTTDGEKTGDEVYKEADIYLSQNKRDMYKKLKIDRRK